MSVADYDSVLVSKAVNQLNDNSPTPATKIAYQDISEVLRHEDESSDSEHEVLQTKQVKPPNPNRARRAKFGEYSFILRRLIYPTPRGGWGERGATLEIQSKTLQDQLRKLFNGENSGGVDLGNSPIRIPSPYKLLFHGRHQIEEFLRLNLIKTESSTTQNEMRLLLDFMETNQELKRAQSLYDSHVPRGMIRFSILWTIYVPGSLSIYNLDGVQECYRCKRTTKRVSQQRGPYYAIEVVGMDYDGTRIGLTTREITIFQFQGSMEISQLSLVPIQWYPQSDVVREALVERGKQFEELVLAGSSHLYYSGNVWNPDPEERHYNHICDILISDFTAKERVVIDYATYLEFNPERRPRLHAKKLQPLDDDQNSGEGDTEQTVHVMIDAEPLNDNKLNCSRLETAYERRLFGDDFYAVFPARIPGFALGQRRWGWFSLGEKNMISIQWKDDPLKLLEMDSATKHLISALIEGHMQETGSSFDDVVTGKGKGLVFMLHGPPGLGKTLTAETISEHSQRPLYVVTSGELTIEAATMEKQMQKIFRVGEKWRAIVLIDEADVMMSKRSAGTLETNAIVSVFLRLIEYYQGILFLTTNLIEAFDEAIFNRVHLIIKFPNLEPATRQTIWRNLLVSYSTSGALNTDNSWTPQVYEALGNIPINGRTIKNLLRTASCYAKAEKVPLAVRHLRVVMQTSLAEIDYGEAWGMFLAAVKSTEAVN